MKCLQKNSAKNTVIYKSKNPNGSFVLLGNDHEPHSTSTGLELIVPVSQDFTSLYPTPLHLRTKRLNDVLYSKLPTVETQSGHQKCPSQKNAHYSTQ